MQRPLAEEEFVSQPAAVEDYRIQPGDLIDVFVWRNPDVSVTVSVRPDGKVSTPLVEDMPATGKTPTELARDIEQALKKFIRDPMVTVIVKGFSQDVGQTIRVIGAAAHPQVLQYRKDMSLLDVMIAVGGLSDYAAGNRANIVRRVKGKQHEFPVRLEDLMVDGDITANVSVQPGDILIIPESVF
ncbi:MAG: sugar ABC transporter substrate-binding protein [Gammaproteobacteria bacterium]|nr:sugar ABC transporter substrate-binding protein [Gammaproteobacteria bacterium]